MFRRVIKNSGSNVLVLVVRVAITLVMTPVILHALGDYDFGIWEIVSAVVGYMGLLDLGMKPAITRYAALYNGHGSREKLSELFATSCLFMLAVGFLLFVSFILWGLFGADVLAESGEPEDRYIYFLLIIACQLLITFPGCVAQSFIFGFQKYALNNMIIVCTLLVGAALIYQYIDKENALVLVAFISTAGMFIRYTLLFFIVAMHKDMAIRFKMTSANLRMFNELIRFGFKSFVQGAGSVVENQSAALLVGWLMGPAYVVFYAMPASIARYLQTVGWAVSDTFMPLFSDLYARQENDKVLQVYLDYSRYLLGGVLPLGLSVFLFGPDFIALWVGPEYIEDGQLLLAILVLSFLLPLLDPFGSHLLIANNRHGILAVISPLAAVLNIVSSIIFINFYGVLGAALGALLPACVATPIILKYVCKELDISVMFYLKRCLFPLLFPVLIFVVMVSLLLSAYSIDSYFDLLSLGAVAVAVYALLFFYLVLNSYERNKIVVYIISR